MIPSSSIANMYVKLAGQESLLSMAQGNLYANLDRVSKVRTHTFLENNGQKICGISQNFGNERYYTWSDTIIDCRNTPSLVQCETLKDMVEVISNNPRFIDFKDDIEERMNGHVTVEPFCYVLRGEENMRYNIRRVSKVEDFDMIRIGIAIKSDSEEAFKAGLKYMEDLNNPYKINMPQREDVHLNS